MKYLQLKPLIMQGRVGGGGLKNLNLSPPHPVVRGKNLAPSLPHHLYGAGKTRTGRSEEGRVKRGLVLRLSPL